MNAQLTNYNITYLADSTSGTISFSSVHQLLRIKDEGKLERIISSTLCLSTMVEADTNEELSKMIDFVTNLKVKNKRLHVKLSSELESNVLQNRRINFNMIISHLGTGNIDL